MDQISNGDTSDEAAFRAEVRAFIAEAFDADLQSMAARQAGIFAEGEFARRWHKALYEQGWVAPAWPREHGGPGWTWRQRQIFLTEVARAGIPNLPGLGLNLCAPVIMKFGTEAQKAFFLPKILSNEIYFCQGYSEPQSGSDLASLQTRALRDGDDYVVNGSKIWTTHAQYANWIFMLVRTSSEGRPQEGISFLVAPMDSPGISIRPILSISGEHEVNQVFLDDVRVPVANRVGEENQGWTVAKYLLEFERGGNAVGVVLRTAMDRAVALVREQPAGEGVDTLLADPNYRRRLALLDIDVLAAEAFDLRVSSGLKAGESVGNAAASMKKLAASELGQKIAELSMESLGVYAAPDQRPSMDNNNIEPVGPESGMTRTIRFLNGRANTIYAGSSEVQRNILARTILK